MTRLDCPDCLLGWEELGDMALGKGCGGTAPTNEEIPICGATFWW